MQESQVRKGLFKSEKLESDLFKSGYIKTPFFTDDELAELKNFYYNVHPNEKIDLQGTLNGIHMTTWSGNYGYKRMVGSFLNQLFAKGANRIFKNHRLLNHVFIAKEPGVATEFNIHQDWSVVDETKEYSVNIWVPLHDVSDINGALWILPGSHKLDQPIRGAGCLFPNYISEMDQLRSRVKCIDVKAGEALIFFHATIHGSPPNNGNERRVVACCTAIHEQAELITYFQKEKESPLQVYNPSDDFMYTYRDIMNESSLIAPKGKLVETRESYTLNALKTDDLLTLIH